MPHRHHDQRAAARSCKGRAYTTSARRWTAVCVDDPGVKPQGEAATDLFSRRLLCNLLMRPV